MPVSGVAGDGTLGLVTEEDPFDDLDDDEVEPFGTPADGVEDHPVPGEDTAGEGGGSPTTKMETWRRRSASGAILTGIALGLQQVFEPKHDEPAIVIETSGDPPDDLPVEADFEFRRPRQSVVSIRPWLIASDQSVEDDSPKTPDATPPEAADGSGPG